MRPPEETTGSPGKLAVWMTVVRPFAFSASVAPVLVAAALAGSYDGSPVRWGLLPLVLVGTVLLHAATNLVGEADDYQRGVDHDAAVVASRVLIVGQLTPTTVRKAGWLLFALGAVCGVGLVWQCGWPVAVFAAAGIFGGVFYTARPIGYKYIALGDPLVFVLMGPLIVAGTHYCLTGSLMGDPWWVSLPVGSLVAAILAANNLRDIRHDTESKIRTIAIVLGPTGAKIEYGAFVVAAYVCVGVLVVVGVVTPWGLCVLLSVPLAVKVLRAAAGANVETPEQIASLDVQTAQLHMVFCALLTLGLIVGVLW